MAISECFQKGGFSKTSPPTVVDPNLVAARLSVGENISFYVGDAQEFFKTHHRRQTDSQYVFHLGTLLNVVDPKTATDILELVAKNMQSNDILSSLTVAQSQFDGVVSRKKLIKVYDDNNLAGLGSYIYADLNKSKKHYKTVIFDLAKYSDFLTKGLELEMINKRLMKAQGSISRDSHLNVAFQVWVGKKKGSTS